MKFLKIAAIIFSVGPLLMLYGYVNLQVSYKYEVDLMETHVETDENLSASEKNKRLVEIKQIERDIFFQLKVVKVLFVVFVIGLITVLYFLFVRK